MNKISVPLSVTIIYNKANTFGLEDDVRVIQRLLKTVSIGHPIQAPRLVDLREPPSHSDIQIHLEIPVYSAIPWAHTNLVLVNPEQWSYAFDAYTHAFDGLLFRDSITAARFTKDYEALGYPTDHFYVLPWCTSWHTSLIGALPRKEEFVCLVGGSLNKYEYLKHIIPQWHQNDPPLTIYTTRPDFMEGLKKVISRDSSVQVIVKDMGEEERYKVMMSYHGHLIVSRGEGFGYAAAHAEAAGSFAIMNRLPVFTEMYSSDLMDAGIAWLSNTTVDVGNNEVRYDHVQPSSLLREELEQAFQAFYSVDRKHVFRTRQNQVLLRFAKLGKAVTGLLTQLAIRVRSLTKNVCSYPPILRIENCPAISIITPTYHRKHLLYIAFHNLLATDYPHNKIEWIVIEDNEKTSQLASEKIISFQVQVPNIQIKYIPIEGRMTIGEKRNCAIEQASHELILFMDDDDHYPSTSFRRRVAWLMKGLKRGNKARIACCTTIAMYDLVRGTSAINVPPFAIPLAQRISEATLTFYKSVWMERKFPNVSVAEGEVWIQGREEEVIELAPQQIIVAFSHGGNQSSRRVPTERPSCFWGFPKEYLIFIHGLIGVTIEESNQ